MLVLASELFDLSSGSITELIMILSPAAKGASSRLKLAQMLIIKKKSLKKKIISEDLQ